MKRKRCERVVSQGSFSCRNPQPPTHQPTKRFFAATTQMHRPRCACVGTQWGVCVRVRARLRAHARVCAWVGGKGGMGHHAPSPTNANQNERKQCKMAPTTCWNEFEPKTNRAIHTQFVKHQTCFSTGVAYLLFSPRVVHVVTDHSWAYQGNTARQHPNPGTV